jgi:hypothetical protein
MRKHGRKLYRRFEFEVWDTDGDYFGGGWLHVLGKNRAEFRWES